VETIVMAKCIRDVLIWS